MIDLFGAEGLAALERLSHRRALYAFDFDGTLAPIVAEPDAAAAAPSTVALLSTLGALVPTVLITGRGVDDLRARIDFTPLHLIGNHGAEGMPVALPHALASAVTAHSDDEAHRDVVDTWRAQWPAAISGAGGGDGIVVEAKRYSLSIHYRQAGDHDAARRAITAAIARLEPPPRLIGGKCVVNLLPEGAPDKGSALRTLVRHEDCEAAFFIGDDLTDEAAFDGAPADWVTVRVGRDEQSAARFFIDDQARIDACLTLLVAHAEAAAGAR